MNQTMMHTNCNQKLGIKHMKTPYRNMGKDKLAGYFAEKERLKDDTNKDKFIIQHFIPDINLK